MQTLQFIGVWMQRQIGNVVGDDTIIPARRSYSLLSCRFSREGENGSGCGDDGSSVHGFLLVRPAWNLLV
jgi:hypothetical protein